MNRIRVLSLVAALFFVFSCTAFAQSTPFDDVGDSHWALKHIMKMELSNIVTGYEDGTFRPNREVTQLESIIMAVRALGYSDSNVLIDRSVAETYNLPTSWNASGYVSIALREGLVDSDNLRPQEQASRAWVAQLIVRLIGTDNYSLSSIQHFSDYSSIPQWAQSYVAQAVEKEIITGINGPNGSVRFEPNSTITRAQLATMLSRSDRYVDSLQQKLPQATIEAIDFNSITLRGSGYTSSTYPVSSTAIVFSGDSRILPSALNRGDVIRFGVDNRNQIVYIEKLSEQDVLDSSVRGVVVQHLVDSRLLTIRDEDNRLHDYTYTSGTTVRNSSGAVIQTSPSSISAGEDVLLYVNASNQITSIQLLGSSQAGVVQGEIFSIDLRQYILTLNVNGRYTSYSLHDNVYVEYKDVRFATLQDLQVGDEVEISLRNGQVDRITLINPNSDLTASGVVVGVIPSSDIINIRLSNGSVQAFELARNAEIILDGLRNPTIEDIHVDDEVEVKVENELITEIEITNRSYSDEYVGTVRSIDVDEQIITIDTDRNQLRTYAIDDRVILDLDVSRPDLDDIYVGMRVYLEVVDDVVVKITERNRLEGELVRIERNDTYISLRIGNRTETFPLDDSVKVVMEGVSNPDLDDLEYGQNVSIRLSLDWVTHIYAETQYSYEVVDVDATRKRITIKDGNRNRTIGVPSSATIEIANVRNPELDDINKGDIALITYSGNTVKAIQITPPQFGFIRSIDLFRDTITIESVEGLMYIPIDKYLSTKNHNDSDIHLSTLTEGDYVQIVTVGDDVTLYRAMKDSGRFSLLNTSTGRLYIMDDADRYQSYKLSSNVAVWKNNTLATLGDLRDQQQIEVYLIDGEIVAIRIL